MHKYTQMTCTESNISCQRWQLSHRNQRRTEIHKFSVKMAHSFLPYQATGSTSSHKSKLSILAVQTVGSCGHQPHSCGPKGMSQWKGATPQVQFIHWWGTSLSIPCKHKNYSGTWSLSAMSCLHLYCITSHFCNALRLYCTTSHCCNVLHICVHCKSFLQCLASVLHYKSFLLCLVSVLHYKSSAMSCICTALQIISAMPCVCTALQVFCNALHMCAQVISAMSCICTALQVILQCLASVVHYKSFLQCLVCICSALQVISAMSCKCNVYLSTCEFAKWAIWRGWWGKRQGGGGSRQKHGWAEKVCKYIPSPPNGEDKKEIKDKIPVPC